MGEFAGAAGTALMIAAAVVGIGFFARLGMELADYLIYGMIAHFLGDPEEEGPK